MNYLIIFATIVAILPVIFIKSYIKNNKKNYLFGAVICYLLLLLSYIKIFKSGYELSQMYVILQILQILLVFFIGILLFNERITRNKILGTVLGISGVYFLLNK